MLVTWTVGSTTSAAATVTVTVSFFVGSASDFAVMVTASLVSAIAVTCPVWETVTFVSSEDSQVIFLLLAVSGKTVAVSLEVILSPSFKLIFPSLISGPEMATDSTAT